MSSVLLGAVAACGASSLYNVGLALQALDAREAPHGEALRATLLLRLARRTRWLAGTALNIAGWPLQTVALLLAPLAVVQPSLAFGLAVLLVIGARRLGERVGPREILAVAGILGGVALLAGVAPDPSTRHAGPAALAAVLGGVGVVAVAPLLLARAGRGGGALMMLAAGAALAWSGLSTKLVADALHAHQLLLAGLWAAATGLASGLGLLCEMSALQRRPATQVAPVVFVVQVVVPVAAAPLLVSERWHHGAAMAVGLALVLASAVALLASPALRPFVDAGGGSSADSGVADSPVADSRAESEPISPTARPGSASSTTTSPRAGAGIDATAAPDTRT
jgi:drug/metabolite transporter (DMT)-like permease